MMRKGNVGCQSLSTYISLNALEKEEQRRSREERTPGSTRPLKKAKASELIASKRNSSSCILKFSIVSTKFGHFIACANLLRTLTCRLFSLYLSFAGRPHTARQHRAFKHFY